MYTDRKKLVFRWPGSKVAPCRWELAGEGSAPHQGVYQPSHPQTLNVYAGITMYGVTNVHIVAGTSTYKPCHVNKQGAPAKNITSAEYRDVLFKTLLREGQRLFGIPGLTSWVLQQDGDPTHAVAHGVVRTWNRSHASNVQLLKNWPPNSPDLNPIENVWAYVQAKVNKKGCSSFPEFKAAVIYELKHIDKRMLTKLIKSMPKRIAEVIARGGGKTKY